jgi:multidrug resistance efflux pump
MRTETMIDLNECTEFRQGLRAHAPGIVHGTAILLIGLLTAAVTWMALTEANLVVTGQGRVRPISDSVSSEDDLSQEISSERDGRVVEVNAVVGDEIRAGDVLVRLDTAQLDIQIGKLEQAIRAGREKIEQLERSDGLLTSRYTAARQKAQAELDQAVAEVEDARRRQAADVRLAQIALAAAQDKAQRRRDLAARGVLTKEELNEAETKIREAEEKLRKAQLPLNERKVDVLRRALVLTEREYELEKQKLAVERKTKQDETDAASYDLARLQHEHQQSVIRAPADCIVTKADVKVGDIAKAGKIGITTARQRGFEFEVEVSAANIAHLASGMPVQMKMDAFDYQKYGVLPGTVRFVAPDSTLKKSDEGKQAAVYNVKVSLQADELRRGDNHGKIKLGMTGKAEIVTDKESILLILVRKIHKKISLG